MAQHGYGRLTACDSKGKAESESIQAAVEWAIIRSPKSITHAAAGCSISAILKTHLIVHFCFNVIAGLLA